MTTQHDPASRLRLPVWRRFAGLGIAFAIFLLAYVILAVVQVLARDIQIPGLIINIVPAVVTTGIALAVLGTIPALLFTFFLEFRPRPTALECVLPGLLLGALVGAFLLWGFDDERADLNLIDPLFCLPGGCAGMAAWLYWRDYAKRNTVMTR